MFPTLMAAIDPKNLPTRYWNTSLSTLNIFIAMRLVCATFLSAQKHKIGFDSNTFSCRM